MKGLVPTEEAVAFFTLPAQPHPHAREIRMRWNMVKREWHHVVWGVALVHRVTSFRPHLFLHLFGPKHMFQLPPESDKQDMGGLLVCSGPRQEFNKGMHGISNSGSMACVGHGVEHSLLSRALLPDPRFSCFQVPLWAANETHHSQVQTCLGT